MNVTELEAYENAEREYVRAHGHSAVLDGYVTNAAAMYRDRLTAKRLAFHRSGAPLSALLLLYEQTVVYFPPLGRIATEKRLGMKWDVVLALVERGCIQPIIGHPVDYAGKRHFDELLAFSPPSVWARGDELAHRFAHAAEHWDVARSLLPLDAMVSLPWLRQKYRQVFPRLGQNTLSERIATELCTNYVDLCIYGYEDIARDLARIDEHSWGARRVLELSELLTYPSLMGMGGTANYGMTTGSAVQAAAESNFVRLPDMVMLPDEAQLLVDGLSIAVPRDLSADLVVEFHKDNMASTLWSALEELEVRVAEADGTDVHDLIESAVASEQIVARTMAEVRGVAYGSLRARMKDRIHPVTDVTVKLGSTVAVTSALSAPLGWNWMATGLTVAGLAWATKLLDGATKAVEERITDELMERKSSKLATQLWWLTQWRDRAVSGDHASG